MEQLIIDINSDLGEGMPNDIAIMPLISSCNIACGGHAGNEYTMKHTINLALENHVKIGAHPSYPDPENFGRLPMEIELHLLEESLLNQIQLLEKLLGQAGEKLHHIKPHGALYNQAAVDKKIASIIIKIMKENFGDTFLYAPYGSVTAQLAKKEKINLKYEVFADRNYNDDLTLVNRKEPNAVLHDAKAVKEHLLLMIQKQLVKTVTGNLKLIEADTVCVHGDNPEALALTSAIHNMLSKPITDLGE
ncbi:5-oxoprolinase subunit PxpA [Mangrovimonas aestuarii]|uniref:5-oxoprolinase subunit PxpA n=1 Tax=Mangrovimonas aestuarii TaxID=3018443 RepID=UPI0023799E79|nr:5-oxoprolinase subunit PxpA [Mangrovimonas aestuarii]